MPITRAHFNIRVRELTTREPEHLVSNTGYLISDLIMTNAAWTSSAIVGMLTGAHGEAVKPAAWCGAFRGCDGVIRGNHAATSAYKSFAHWCVEFGRVDILRAVVDIGVPADFPEVPGIIPVATTPTGIMLDRLASQSGTWTTFPHVLRGLRRKLPEGVISECVRLLLNADPNHPGIAEAQGTELGALFTETLMSRRIASGSASDSAGEIPAPGARRRARVV